MKPILFNTEMVRAILDGRKTVTRRVVKPQPILYGVLEPHWSWAGIKAPYEVGDILYVRETFGYSCWAAFTNETIFKAGASERAEKAVNCGSGWKPSIHMPREAARIFLRVTNVRVERLQDIDGYGVLAEGVDNGSANPTMGKRWENMQRMAYSKLWNTTVKKSDLDKCDWAANPWVWVIEFERISREEAYDV